MREKVVEVVGLPPLSHPDTGSSPHGNINSKMTYATLLHLEKLKSSFVIYALFVYVWRHIPWINRTVDVKRWSTPFLCSDDGTLDVIRRCRRQLPLNSRSSLWHLALRQWCVTDVMTWSSRTLPSLVRIFRLLHFRETGLFAGRVGPCVGRVLTDYQLCAEASREVFAPIYFFRVEEKWKIVTIYLQ